jgi:3-(3-hydroxy-phenyl)propionate hydroxylase
MTRLYETPLYPYAPAADERAARPARRPVVIVGAGPVGLTAAIDLALHDVPVVVLDENDRVSFGSRALCYAKRTLEILGRLGVADDLVAQGVEWRVGKVFVDERLVWRFDLLPEGGHRRPAFVNLQQYRLEERLVARLRALAAEGRPVELRGRRRVVAVAPDAEGVDVAVDTPDGPGRLRADWLIACDGAASPVREMLGAGFVGRSFEDNFLIADVKMAADYPTERWFWFDPPFNRGRSALLHRQPDDLWRIDLQLGRDIDREAEKRPEAVIPRLRAMLGPDRAFSLDWVSIYAFRCRRMARFRHGRVIFAGDSAHQVSPFGARGANGGVQDADNLVWKLAAVLRGAAPETLLDSYDAERGAAADENIRQSTRSTDFIAPQSPAGRRFRDATLDLAGRCAFARPLVNSGRLSTAACYDGSSLNGPDALPGGPDRARPGAAAPDAALGEGFLLDRLGGRFALLAVDAAAPAEVAGLGPTVAISARDGEGVAERWLGAAPGAIYLIRPDQHVAARWPAWDAAAVAAALARACGRPGP